MNSIHLHSISKKFGRQEIFSGITAHITESKHIAIIGYNGSGKSTLLQILAGYISPSTGHMQYKVKDRDVSTDSIYQHISFTAPYLELVEEFTALETVDFYGKFKPFDSGLSNDEILETALLGYAAKKQVKFFSSGMKQRLKLTLALVSDVPFVFLDEPVSNLDKPGIAWYHEMILQFGTRKTLIICSNDSKVETDFCQQVLRIEDFKKV